MTLPPSALDAAQVLAQRVDRLTFSPPITHVYNPLDYAWEMHALYLARFGQGKKRVIFLGMNPGPFGMVQTGVPFGEVTAVKEWLKLSAPVYKPRIENPKKPVDGLSCTKSEVSGRRLWGYFAEKFGTPEAFFQDHFVLNYCPLAFLDGTRNITPDKLPQSETADLLSLCDEHLRAVVAALKPDWLVGVGKYARKQAERALSPDFPDLAFGDILHPSPASPAANRGWAGQADKQMVAQGIWS